LRPHHSIVAEPATPGTLAALRPAATVRAAGEDGQLVLLDLASGRYFSLNAVGLRVWRRLEAGSSPEQAADALAADFSMPLQVVRSDVAELVAYLAGRGLLVATAEPATLRPRPAPTAPPAAPAEATPRHPSAALVAAAWLTLVDFDLALRLGDLARCLGKLCPLPASAPVGPEIVDRVVAAVDRAAALYFKRAWCLQRSAACVRMLRRRGVPARLVLGVRPMPFYAHAWAELDGRVINDREWVCGLAVLERF
jgi:hypothetical protein